MRKFLYLVLFTIAWLHTPLATAITAGIRTDQKDNTDTTHSKGYKTIEAQTQQWFFRPKLTTGMSHLKYEESDRNFKWSDNVPFIGIGGTMYYGKLSAELYAQVSDKGQDDSFTRNITPTLSNTTSYTQDVTTIYDTDFKKIDYSALLSYEVIEGLSIFGSYKTVTLEVNRRDTAQTRSELITNIGNSNETKTSKIGDITTTIQQTNFTTKGPALGVAYNYYLNSDMQLGVSFAYGWLEADRKQNGKSTETEPATGQAYGINFTHRLPQHHLKYILALENYGYQMDAVERVMLNNVVVKENPFTIKEDMTTFKATLVWEF